MWNKMRGNKLEQGIEIANKAMQIFNSTVDDLKRSNEVLSEVIDNEQEVINKANLKLGQAKIHIGINHDVIKSMESFMCR